MTYNVGRVTVTVTIDLDVSGFAFNQAFRDDVRFELITYADNYEVAIADAILDVDKDSVFYTIVNPEVEAKDVITNA